VMAAREASGTAMLRGSVGLTLFAALKVLLLP